MWFKSGDGAYLETEGGAKVYARETQNGQGVMVREILLLRPGVQNAVVQNGYDSLAAARDALDDAMEGAGVAIVVLADPNVELNEVDEVDAPE